MGKLRDIQLDQKEWVKRNFGDRPASQPLRGIVEEFGELESAKSIAEQDDAIGDILIFMTDYCTARQIDINDVLDILEPSKPSLLSLIGKLCHHDLKLEQQIRGSTSEHYSYITNYLALIIQRLCEVTGESLERISDIAWDVWQTVRTRDWVAERASRGVTA